MTCACSKPSLGGGGSVLLMGGKRRRKSSRIKNKRKSSRKSRKNRKSKKKNNKRRRSVKKRVRIMSGGSFLMGSTIDGSETTNPLYMASKAFGSDYTPHTLSATDINKFYVT
jgi:predicted MarR family transcription regulator